jgi:hypothetical protein
MPGSRAAAEIPLDVSNPHTVGARFLNTHGGSRIRAELTWDIS